MKNLACVVSAYAQLLSYLFKLHSVVYTHIKHFAIVRSKSFLFQLQQPAIIYVAALCALLMHVFCLQTILRFSPRIFLIEVLQHFIMRNRKEPRSERTAEIKKAIVNFVSCHCPCVLQQVEPVVFIMDVLPAEIIKQPVVIAPLQLFKGKLVAFQVVDY
jgi:hypothetical protein